MMKNVHSLNNYIQRDTTFFFSSYSKPCDGFPALYCCEFPLLFPNFFLFGGVDGLGEEMKRRKGFSFLIIWLFVF